MIVDNEIETPPLVTVGMPIYNGESHLAEALESVLAQDYQGLEILVLDDDSSDASGEIVRSLAQRDSRITYMRNDHNLGAFGNSLRTLAVAHGKYFTWLHQDNTLVSPRYISSTVAFLERHPDAVCCASSFLLLDLEGPGTCTVMRLKDIEPDMPWPRARRAFFGTRMNNATYAMHGVFRRDALLKSAARQRARSHFPSVGMELRFLSVLSSYGRIVALPEPLRSFRVTPGSDGDRARRTMSLVGKLRLLVELRLFLLSVALQPPYSFSLSPLIIRTALANFFSDVLRRDRDYDRLSAIFEREAETLRRAADERQRLIRTLSSEIEKRRNALGAAAATIPRTPLLVETDSFEPIPSEPAVKRPRNPIQRLYADLFLPPPREVVERYYQLRLETGRLRRDCDALLETVQRLSDEAAALLAIMEQSRETGSGPSMPSTVTDRPAGSHETIPATGADGLFGQPQ
jgi:hypothetical protein